jgi:hypothetical protein
LRDLGVEGGFNKQLDLKKTECMFVGWTNLVKDRVQWWAVVDIVMTLGVP